MGQKIPDATKLELFESTLDEINQKQLRLRQAETKGNLTFVQEFARLEGKYARDQTISSRKTWQEVFLVNNGKVTARECQDFEVNFKSAWHQVKDSTEDEARRMLISKLPHFLLRWLTEGEEKIISGQTRADHQGPWLY